ncbi:MAG: DNA replication and repair protein RecF [Candidatus Babeliales bacterium]|jgi:DNA replication and repair protein RecF
MLINCLTVRQFRCFTERVFDFQGAKFIVILGKNGVGKSSLLEALHYGCYLRSFRTHVHKDLVADSSDHFFLSVDFNLEQISSRDQLTIGFSEKEGKLVRLNQKIVQSYKELTAQYRIVTLTADDVQLIQGAPERRRDFLNYSLLLARPDLITCFKEFKTILEQRNSLLMQGNVHNDELVVWTEKLWYVSQLLQQARIAMLEDIEKRVNLLLATYFSATEGALTVRLAYTIKGGTDVDFATWWESWQAKQLFTERRFGRSLFGAHLDDVIISFQLRRARVFASRGQQKLIVFLLKIAQTQAISLQGEPAVLLLDDFLTDFDEQRIADCLSVLAHLNVQIFVTSPLSHTTFFKDHSNDTFFIKMD